MSIRKKLGIDFGNIDPTTTREDRIQYINFKLASLGLPIYRSESDSETGTYFIDLLEDIIKDYKEKKRMVDVNEVGIYKRINQFFSNYFQDSAYMPRVVDESLILDHYGLAREMSLPPDGNTYRNDLISSYRIKQGVLHNPKNDRRTTEGSFHIVEGGLSIPYDKKAVPKETFVRLYQAAINPPEDMKLLPFTINQKDQAKTFVSLMVKPIVSPEVPGVMEEKRMEIFFVAPGSFISNLDFIESVFGNNGDPSFHSKDSGLDIDRWSGHTGYILLAPHLSQMRKIDLGLPHYDNATERQRRDGMCYQDEEELYNEGNAFKLTCRDKSGVAVTLIADNYFGYSKKEIKTQISFAANLYGNVEEEHAGGTIAYPQRNLGVHYNAEEDTSLSGYCFDEVIEKYGDIMDFQEESYYGIDKDNKQVIYLPENIKIDLYKNEIKWDYCERECKLKLLPGYFYVLPNGEKIHIEKHPEAPVWKLIGTEAKGTFCHKPCTVSGGGKSEISKSISNSIIYGTYYVNDIEQDLDYVERILNYDYRHRWREFPDRERPARSILSIDRTLGSVIKLLTPSPLYTDEYNAYIEEIPNHVKALVFMVKRFYQTSWGDCWRQHFTVDIINGRPGNELKFDNRRIRPSYLRVGYGEDRAWRIFKLRMDFMPSEKLQMEDDITASILIPGDRLKNINPEYCNRSYKFPVNCEYRFFQRPDDAVHKGYDLQAERDLSSNNLFATNFEPLTKADVEELKNDVMGYISYTEAVRNHIEDFLKGDDEYCVVSSESRIVDGKRSKNPRYLEHRSDFMDPLKGYLAEVGERFSRRIPLDQPVLMPVNAVLPGRRNNPTGREGDKKVPPLSVYNPIHYQDLPELFMDFISSLTGKSPSTTGAGSEGALTKGPFNMLLPVYDLNNALLSYILGDYNGYTTPAGHIGSNIRVDHDISMLVPEIWSRLRESERNPQKLIQEGSFEKVEDFEYNGVTVPAGRLGYRMTEVFCYKYLGRIFDEPQSIFSEDILRPETQGMEAFVDGVMNIVKGHKKAAMNYFLDGSVEGAIPPIKMLLHIMVNGDYEGLTLESPELREMFKRENVVASHWYRERLKNKQEIDAQLMEELIGNLEAFIANPINDSVIKDFRYGERLEKAKERLAYYRSDAYLETLVGTIGAAPIALEE